MAAATVAPNEIAREVHDPKAYEELLDRIESVELAGEWARSKSTFVGGLKALPLRVRAAG